MPLIRNGTLNSKRLADLTDQLAGALHSPGINGQPTISEGSVGQTGKFIIRVIWDEWEDLSPMARSRAILDAYERIEPAKTGKIAIALGLTSTEATSIGILPFAVVPALKHEESNLRERVIAVMKQEGAFQDVMGNWNLRFGTREEARQAFLRLQKAIPGNFWLIEESRPGDQS